MIQYLNKIKGFFTKSDFTKNVLTLASGAALSQFITIAAAPITARLYEPADYGVLGMYMSITALVSVLCTLRYETAILLPDGDEKTIDLVYLCSLLITIFTVLTLIFSVFFRSILAAQFKLMDSANWLLLLPISVCCTCFAKVFTVYNNKKKRYKNITLSRTIPAFITVILSLTLGYFFKGAMGLVVSLVVGHIAAAAIVVVPIYKNDRHIFKYPNQKRLKIIAQEYKDYPLFSLPADFINNLINQIPLFFLSAHIGPQAVGYYNMSNRLLGLPTQFVAGAIGEVFRQTAADDYSKKGNCRPIFLKTLRTLFFIGIVPYTIVGLFAPEIFAFALGEKWRIAGSYSQIMVFLLFTGFITSPLTYMYYVADKLREDFIFHIYILASMFLVFYISVQFTTNIYTILTTYVINYVIIYLVYLVRSYQFSGGENSN